MIESQAALAYHVTKFYNKRTLPRKASIAGRVEEVARVVNSILKEVVKQEPRFASSLNERNGRLEGLEVISPNEYEVILFLNQTGVFNFMDDGTVPGCAALKLIDGRKRSMSLWVEFITASGYLSARKVRSRYQSLVSQVVENLHGAENVRVQPNTTDVQLVIQDVIMVRMVPAFHCSGLWPQSANRWPAHDVNTVWPSTSKITEVKAGGVNLLSKQVVMTNEKQNVVESDAWVISFTEAEDNLIGIENRKKCLSILKTLRDRHLDFQGSPLNNYHMKTLLLYECDKHQNEAEWSERAIGDRLQGILLQLVSCLRCRKLPHYFVPAVDLISNAPPDYLDMATKQVWYLAREIITSGKNLENL